eukprot:GHVP01020725.1.p1 GENE.GHVP01020725.1~~GHVP01020725.1.p1  ORF type:complete len:195 (+),score=35.04 GHVP01020725.1:303-887(+)
MQKRRLKLAFRRSLDDISEESVTLHDISERCEKTGWELTIAFHYKEDGSIPQFDKPKPNETYFTRAPNGLYFPSYESKEGGRVYLSPMEPLTKYGPHKLLFNIWVDKYFEEPELEASKVLEKDKEDFKTIQHLLRVNGKHEEILLIPEKITNSYNSATHTDYDTFMSDEPKIYSTSSYKVRKIRIKCLKEICKE